MASSARLAEAQECEKRAADCLKTSMIKLKFKPDFDGAATALERASVCYRNANDIKNAVRVLLEAAQHYEQNGNIFHAAKAREGAAMLSRDSGDSASAYTYFEQAIDGYAMAGSLDTAAMTVEKAAKVIVQGEPLKAIQLFEKGLALVQQSDRSKMAGEFLNQITKINLKLERYNEAAKAIREEIEKYVEVKESPRVGQLAIGLILTQLALEDSVAATKSFGWVLSVCPDFEFTDDARACQQMIYNYENGDDEQFQNVLNCGSLKSMDNEYLRLQKKLKAPHSETAENGGNGDEDEDDLR
ncbi:unnamed protein product [Auanema sp. JU1783]|nr:unnamed protein product [Auanema sp. JU1783]